MWRMTNFTARAASRREMQLGAELVMTKALDQVSGLDPIHFPSPWRIRRIGPSGSRNTQYPVWGHPTITNLRSPAR